MQQNHSASSWIELILFTLFLFLLVAIPYTIYIQSVQQKSTIIITNLPTIIVKPTTMPTITPPPASAATTCIPVPETYMVLPATPAAYLFQDKRKEVCYPPSLPPFPFTWQPYISYQYGYTIDTPNNWIDKSTTIKGVRQNIFVSEENTGTSLVPAVSFSWQSGTDPYATDSSYLKETVEKNGTKGIVYTKGPSYIAAIFPMETGYFILDAELMDSSFYAFEHMLDSLTFSH